MANAETNSYIGECLLTCPPYDDIERYPIGDVLLHNCDDWIDICIRQCDCRRYVFVVDNRIEKWKSNVVEEISNRSHFEKNVEYVVVIEK